MKTLTETLNETTFKTKVFDYAQNEPQIGKPSMGQGLVPKAELERIIEQVLKVKKPGASLKGK